MLQILRPSYERGCPEKSSLLLKTCARRLPRTRVLKLTFSLRSTLRRVGSLDSRR